MKDVDFGKKPFGTKIQLTTGGDFFEAYIPPVGFHPVILVLALFTVMWIGGIAIWTFGVAQAPFPINIFFAVFSLPFWFIGGFLVYGCLFTLFGKTYLRIDRHEISLTKTIFGVQVSRQKPQPKREITKLIFTREHFYRDAEGGRVNRPAALKLEIGAKSIELGGRQGDIQGGIESEAEMEWLAFEVSEWLDKPLKIIEPSAIG
jgi:hypothetical protein